MSAPRHLFKAWGELQRQVRRANHLALFADFDGTLVPIRRWPDQARLTGRTRQVLTSITRRIAVVGVVSGRNVEDVQARVGLRQIWYVGAHGFFLRYPCNRLVSLVTPKQRKRITTVRQVLIQELGALPGILLESKGATIAVHYRNASRRSRQLARLVIERLLRDRRGLRLLRGKKVWELLPDSQTDKWAAIQFILRYERKRRPGGQWLIFYLGDDVTDEQVFEKLNGISVAVGKRKDTAAHFFLRSPGEVRQFLERFEETTP